MKHIGSHVSANGGISNAIDNAVRIGAQGTFAFFLSSPRTWRMVPLDETSIEKFKSKLEQNGIKSKNLLPHGSYLLNLASNDVDILSKSRTGFHAELQKCKQLGISLYNVHPGSAGKDGKKEDALNILIESINLAHQKVSDVTIVIENMSGQGNVLCSDLSDFAFILDKVCDKTRLGFCLDTCHLFAAGYDISKGITTVLQEFDIVVGREYLKAFHLNDSMYDLGMKKDRHQNLGKGKIGWLPFEELMKDRTLDDIIFITETPGNDEDSLYELNMLKSLIDSLSIGNENGAK